MDPKDRIIVALDVDTPQEAKELVELLAPHVGVFKVGLQLINRVGGPQIVSIVHAMGGDVMYDIKLHDIPNTMIGAAEAISGLGVWGFTFHACAGHLGIKAAAQHAGKSLAIGVTVLTSHKEEECRWIFGESPSQKVEQFAHWLDDFGAGAIVCSPQEVGNIKGDERTRRLIAITPGVRPLWSTTDDQQRITTPSQAIKAGADYLVIGRPILKPPPEIGSPVEAAKRIAEEIAQAL